MAAAYIKANISEPLELDAEAQLQQAELEPEPSRSEVQQRSYSELLNAMLKATTSGDDDELMELRAETIGRFRRKRCADRSGVIQAAYPPRDWWAGCPGAQLPRSFSHQRHGLADRGVRT